MLLDKFKQGKDIDLVKGIEKYVSLHFGSILLKKESIKFSKIQNFLNSIAITRGIVSNLNSLEKSFDAMKSYKEQLVSYIAMINLLKSKFNFGNDKVRYIFLL